VHRHHPHTMGDGSCTWFGVISSTASAVGSVKESTKMLRVGSAHQRCLGGILMEMGNHIQQSTKAGGGAGRQWRGGADGGR